MRLVALTYDEKMIMKSMKRKANEKISLIQKVIKDNANELSFNDVILMLDEIKKEITYMKV